MAEGRVGNVRGEQELAARAGHLFADVRAEFRRRVAELMRLLESESRFQAGVRAGELGLTR